MKEREEINLIKNIIQKYFIILVILCFLFFTKLSYAQIEDSKTYCAKDRFLEFLEKFSYNEKNYYMQRKYTIFPLRKDFIIVNSLNDSRLVKTAKKKYNIKYPIYPMRYNKQEDYFITPNDKFITEVDIIKNKAAVHIYAIDGTKEYFYNFKFIKKCWKLVTIKEISYNY